MKDLLYLYESCVLCPRRCGVNRLKGESGYCGSGTKVSVSCAVLHRGEEPPVTGTGGSGAVFFTGCTLKCSFCQNYQISRGGCGIGIEAQELADIFLSLQKKGAENINLVTGTHFVPGIITALRTAKKQGLTVPVLWNTSGYETADTLKLLSGFIDVFLPDLKTLDSRLSDHFFSAADYPVNAAAAVLKMASLRPLKMKMIEDEKRIKSGTIMRHLVIPGELESTRSVLKWYSENVMDKAVISLMFQYTPNSAGCEVPEGFISGDEADQVYDMLEKFGIEEGFIQELEDNKMWLPDFTKVKPFAGAESGTVWHWSCGFKT